jgi:hypothetical protein
MWSVRRAGRWAKPIFARSTFIPTRLSEPWSARCRASVARRIRRSLTLSGPLGVRGRARAVGSVNVIGQPSASATGMMFKSAGHRAGLRTRRLSASPSCRPPARPASFRGLQCATILRWTVAIAMLCGHLLTARVTFTASAVFKPKLET